MTDLPQPPQSGSWTELAFAVKVAAITDVTMKLIDRADMQKLVPGARLFPGAGPAGVRWVMEAVSEATIDYLLGELL